VEENPQSHKSMAAFGDKSQEHLIEKPVQGLTKV
jgi:hypothetical protein